MSPKPSALTLSLLAGGAVMVLSAPASARPAPPVPFADLAAASTAIAGAEPAAQAAPDAPAQADGAGAADMPPLAPFPGDPPAPAAGSAGTSAPAPASAAAASAPPLVVSGAAAGDPLERTNRRFYAGFRRADRKVIGPIARGYRRTLPRPIRSAVHNGLSNLGEPVVFVNDLLQLRIDRALHTLGRFCVNTVFGLGGLVDVGSRNNLPHHDNDFGVTLGRYGVKPGAYLFLPVLGPSTVRDAAGRVVDYFISPWRLVHYGGERTVAYTTGALGVVDARANAEEDLQAIDNMSTDPYATTRSLYLQDREALVRGKPVDVNDLPDFEDPAGAAAQPAPAAATDATPAPDSAAPPGPQLLPETPQPAPDAAPEAPREPLV